MTYAIQQRGTQGRRRPDLAEDTAQARMADRLGDMADQVSLAVHRQLNGRDWDAYAPAVHRTSKLFSNVAAAVGDSANPRVSFSGARALRFISRYGAAATQKEDGSQGGEKNLSHQAPDTYTVEILINVDKELIRFIEHNIDEKGLKFLRSFFDSIADATLNSGRDRGER